MANMDREVRMLILFDLYIGLENIKALTQIIALQILNRYST